MAHNDNTAKGTVTLQVQIPLQRMRDILTTAYEQGIAYWVNDGDFDLCEVQRDEKNFVMQIKLRRNAGSKTPEFARNVRAGNHAYATVTDTDLAIAFGRALNIGDDGEPVHPEAAKAAASELNDTYDANTADVLVQFAFFGEVIYG